MYRLNRMLRDASTRQQYDLFKKLAKSQVAPATTSDAAASSSLRNSANLGTS